MKIINTRMPVAVFVGLIVLLLQISPALAGGPAEVTFTGGTTAGA